MAVEPPPKKAKTDEAAVIKPAAAAPVVTPTLTKAAALGLPAQVPFRPVLPSGSDVAGGKTQSLKSYIVQMYKSVVARLSLFLYDCVSVSLRKPLYQVTCPPIAVASASGDTHRPTSFREAWDMKNRAPLVQGILVYHRQDARGTLPGPACLGRGVPRESH